MNKSNTLRYLPLFTILCPENAGIRIRRNTGIHVPKYRYYIYHPEGLIFCNLSFKNVSTNIIIVSVFIFGLYDETHTTVLNISMATK